MDEGLGIIGLALRAGKLAVGDKAVSEAVRDKKARLICTAKDAGTRVRESAMRAPERCNGLYADTTIGRVQLGQALGLSDCGVIAFLDPGLAWAFAEKLAKADGDRYGTLEQELKSRKDRAEKRKAKKRDQK